MGRDVRMLIALALAALVGAGCGDGGDRDPTGLTSETSSTAAPDPGLVALSLAEAACSQFAALSYEQTVLVYAYARGITGLSPEELATEARSFDVALDEATQKAFDAAGQGDEFDELARLAGEVSYFTEEDQDELQAVLNLCRDQGISN